MKQVIKVNDFMMAVMPWLVITITTVLCIFMSKKKHKDMDMSDEDYMVQGMTLGMCFGTAIGSSLINIIGTEAISYGISFGMLIGMIVGMNVKHK